MPRTPGMRGSGSLKMGGTGMKPPAPKTSMAGKGIGAPKGAPPGGMGGPPKGGMGGMGPPPRWRNRQWRAALAWPRRCPAALLPALARPRRPHREREEAWAALAASPKAAA